MGLKKYTDEEAAPFLAALKGAKTQAEFDAAVELLPELTPEEQAMFDEWGDLKPEFRD